MNLTIKYLLIILFVFGVNSVAFSQAKSPSDYSSFQNPNFRRSQYVNNIINSNNPGFSISPYNVGKGYFQIETYFTGYEQLLYVYNRDEFVNNKETYKADKYLTRLLNYEIDLRYGVNDDWEVFTYLPFNKIVSQNDTVTMFNFKPASVGVLYRINNGYSYIPTIAVKGEITYNNLYNTNKEDIAISLITQNNISRRMIIISNWKIDRIFSNNTNLQFVLGMTHAFLDSWSWFVEYYADYNDYNDNLFNDYNTNFNHYLNLGFTYLLNNNTQLNFLGGKNIDVLNKTDYYITVGLSWRIDRKGRKNLFRKDRSPVGAERVFDSNVNYKRYRNGGLH